MSEIYAVSAGEYSDYSVHAIFERREDAEAAIASGFGGRSYDHPHVEEFDYYASGVLPKRVPITRYHAEVEIADGSIVLQNDYSEDEWHHPDGLARKANVTVWPWPQAGAPRRMHLRVDGPKGKRTDKVFTDALAKLRSECIEGLHSAVKR